MNRLLRTAWLVLSAACLVAGTSGLPLLVHLAGHADGHRHEDTGHCHGDGDHARHDSEHCPICQQLLLSKKDFTVAPEPTGFDPERVERIPTVPQTTPILQVSLDRTRPRAPPA